MAWCVTAGQDMEGLVQEPASEPELIQLEGPAAESQGGHQQRMENRLCIGRNNSKKVKKASINLKGIVQTFVIKTQLQISY